MTAAIHIIPVLRDNYCFIIEADNKNCIIVDPGQVTPVETFIQEHQLKPVLILNTHHHADHIAGNADLKARYNTPVIGPKKESHLIPHITGGVSEGDEINESGVRLKVLETPGHTKGHIVFYALDLAALFCGDTLFSMGCGRLLEGDADEMFTSLQKIKSLPPETLIYCGHEYTKANGTFASHLSPGDPDVMARIKDVEKHRMNDLPTIPVTLETELKTNPFLKAGSVEAFAAIRRQKDHF